MVLDQYQPCYEFKVGLSSQDTNSDSSSCNPSQGNQRDSVLSESVELGQVLILDVGFELQTMCPSFTSSVSDECNSKMNSFSLDLLTVDLPSFIEFTPLDSSGRRRL
mmetsp:Transcript_43904/g.42431  ORF Transcript_43904/g.42431 Transcript_43904/m.42431 type:complete len:107 (-) Transcript_43904:1-321(-)